MTKFEKQTTLLAKTVAQLSAADIDAMPLLICGIVDVANFIIGTYPGTEADINDLIFFSVECQNFCTDCDMFEYYCIQYISKRGVKAFLDVINRTYDNPEAAQEITAV